MNRLRMLAGASALALLAPGALAATFLGPSTYLSAADSPFVGPFDYFWLENYEDGALNTPGVSADGGVVLTPDTFTDSVDGDDSFIDGLGTDGHSYYSDNSVSAIRFSFDAGTLGGYPTHVGIVWTDIGETSDEGTGFGFVEFEAWDHLGAPLGTTGPFFFGDGLADGGTLEDRFLGVINDDGVSEFEIRITNSLDWETDHLQYARVPEPATFALLSLLALGLRRR